jgi:hypothetical protein
MQILIILPCHLGKIYAIFLLEHYVAQSCVIINGTRDYARPIRQKQDHMKK